MVLSLLFLCQVSRFDQFWASPQCRLRIALPSWRLIHSLGISGTVFLRFRFSKYSRLDFEDICKSLNLIAARFVLNLSSGDVLCSILYLDEEVKVVILDDVIVRIYVGLLCRGGLRFGVLPRASPWFAFWCVTWMLAIYCWCVTIGCWWSPVYYWCVTIGVCRVCCRTGGACKAGWAAWCEARPSAVSASPFFFHFKFL